MKSYGEIFNYLRKNKGLTLKELAEDGISVSLIAQFEKGQSKISFDRLVILLNKMSVKMDEFMQLVNLGKLPQEDQFMKDYFELINNYAPLADLYHLETEILAYSQAKPSLKLAHFLVYMKLYQAIRVASEKEENNVKLSTLNYQFRDLARPTKDYLFQVEVWGVYELELLNRMSISFEPDILWRLVQQASKRAESFLQLPGLNELVYQTLFSNLTTFVALETFDYAFKTLDLIKQRLTIHESIRYAADLHFYEGWIYYFLGDEKRGEALFAKTIKIYEELSLTQSATSFRELQKNLKTNKEAGSFLVMVIV